MPLQDAGGVKVVVRASSGNDDSIGEEYVDVVVVMMGTISLGTGQWSLWCAAQWPRNERTWVGFEDRLGPLRTVLGQMRCSPWSRIYLQAVDGYWRLPNLNERCRNASRREQVEMDVKASVEKTRISLSNSSFDKQEKKRVAQSPGDQILRSRSHHTQYAQTLLRANRRVPNPLGIRARPGAPALAGDRCLLVVNARPTMRSILAAGCGAAAARK